MPKLRTVDPFFWDDPDVALLTRDERLLMIGCWTKLADDEGRFLADPAYVKKQLFGYDDMAISEICGSLRKISEVVRSWHLYSVEGHQYMEIAPQVWKRHQDIRWVVRSRIPAYLAQVNENIATSEDCGKLPKTSEVLRTSRKSAARATRARVDLSRVVLSSLETPTMNTDRAKAAACVPDDVLPAGKPCTPRIRHAGSQPTRIVSDEDDADATWAEWFRIWWDEVCWRKLARPKAEIAFQNAVRKYAADRNIYLQVAFDDIMRMSFAYLARFRHTEDWQFKSKMLPTTFFNQERWTDGMDNSYPAPTTTHAAIAK